MRFYPIFVFTLLFLVLAKTNVLAQISATTNSGCAPLVTQFNLVGQQAIAYQWDFGDGSTSVLANPGKIYSSPGIYTVTVQVVYANNTSTTFTANNLIKVNDKPDASFTFIADSVGSCDQTQRFRFFPNNVLAASSYIWDFGDGLSSSAAQPNHTYNSNGNYVVVLLLTDTNGCQQVDSQIVQVKVRQPIFADFIIADSVICKPNFEIQISNQTIGGNGSLQYKWEINGNSVNSASDSVFYWIPGSYGNFQIRLIAKSNQNCSDTLIRNIEVSKDDIFGNLTQSDSLVCSGTRINFSMDGPLQQYIWRFGNRTAIGNPVSNTYNIEGLYGYQIVGTAPNGCVDTLIRENAIRVINNLQVQLVGNQLPSCAYPIPYSFNGSTNGANLFGYEVFSLPNNLLIGSGTDSTFTFNFPAIGNYKVLFWATAGNCSVADSMLVALNDSLPTVIVSASANEGCLPLSVQFNTQILNLRAGLNLQSVLWDFGNGTTSNNPNVQYLYTQVGQFSPNVSVVFSNGCIQNFTIENGIQVGTKPNASYGPPFFIGCNPLTAAFENTSTDTFSFTTYQWLFNGALRSTDLNPRIVFTIPTTYTGMLVASNYGCTDTFTIINNVEVLPPLAAFGSVNRRGCDTPHVVDFVDQSVGASTWLWDFGDPASGANNFSTLQNPSHVFTQVGVYHIKLTVTNANGCMDSVVRLRFVVITKPIADFQPDSITGCYPITINFTNNSTEGNFNWHFGNGQTSTERNPQTTYNKPGLYPVQLILRDNNGCADTANLEQPLKVLGPNINFSAVNTIGCAPFTAFFIDSTNTANNVVSYRWDFGDLTTLADTSLLPNPQYTYQKRGFYNVSLTVKDTSNCTATLLKNNYIQAVKPIITFTTKDTIRCLGRAVRFTSKIENTVGAVSYLWHFGDGTTATAPNPNKQYQNTGVYTVKLIVTDSLGCVDSLTKQNYVQIIKPNIVLGGNPTTGFCAPHQVQFFDSTAFANSWFWDFGDGTTSNLRNPSKIYTRNGVYTIKLKITTQGGCNDSIVVDSMIRIFGPIANYSFHQLNNCAPATIQFTNLSVDYSASTWDFGDGTIQTVQNPVFVYHLPGNFNPILMVTDSSGCQDVWDPRPQLVIDSVPNANFTVNADSACNNLHALFFDQSTGNPTNWFWDFGNGQTDTTPNPSTNYTPGNYPVTLVVTNRHGCKDTLNKVEPIKVFNQPTANFFAQQPTGCLPHNVQFIDSSFSQRPITAWHWNFGDYGSGVNNISNLKNPTHTYHNNGIYDIYLMVTDANGCTDTLMKEEYITIFDSLPPNKTPIKLVTVQGANLNIKWFSSTIDRFSKYLLYRKKNLPNQAFQLVHSSNNRADTVFIDNQVDVDNFSYCYYLLIQDICGKVSDFALSDIHCSVHLSAIPSQQPFINGIDVAWNHYSGWQPSAYKLYRQAIGEIDFRIIAELPGSVNSFIDKSLCDAENKYLVEAIANHSVGLVSNSNNDKAKPNYHFQNKPIYIQTVTVEDDKNVRVIWRRSPSTNVHKYVINKIFNNGTTYIRNAAILPATDTTWLDLLTDAHEQWYQYEVYEVDSCGNQSPLGSIGRSIHLDSERIGFDVLLNWNHYQGWNNGIEHYLIERLNEANNQWEPVAQVNGNKSDYRVVYQNTNLPAYNFRVTAFRKGHERVTSLSNTTNKVLPTTIFTPNAFSPNGDGINDFFEIKGLHLKQFELVIFDRWGQVIFESRQADKMWNGEINGEQAMKGTYAWMLKIKGFDGREEFLKGVVHLLR